jgi:hypothetical protein
VVVVAVGCESVDAPVATADPAVPTLVVGAVVVDVVGPASSVVAALGWAIVDPADATPLVMDGAVGPASSVVAVLGLATA